MPRRKAVRSTSRAAGLVGVLGNRAAASSVDRPELAQRLPASRPSRRASQLPIPIHNTGSARTTPTMTNRRFIASSFPAPVADERQGKPANAQGRLRVAVDADRYLV